MVAMPGARFLFTTCPKIEPELMLDTIMTYLEGYPLLKEMGKMMTKFKSIRKKPEILKLHYCRTCTKAKLFPT